MVRATPQVRASPPFNSRSGGTMSLLRLRVSLLLCLLFLVGPTSPPVTAAVKPHVPVVHTVLPAAPTEIVRMRTERSKTFRNGDGTLTTRLYGSPVHYRDSRGWRPIPAGVIATGKSIYPWRTAGTPYSASF